MRLPCHDGCVEGLLFCFAKLKSKRLTAPLSTRFALYLRPSRLWRSEVLKRLRETLPAYIGSVASSTLSERDRITRFDKTKADGINEQVNSQRFSVMSEIISEIKAIDTSPRKIRDFGITFLVVFALIGGVLLYKGRSLGYACFGAGVLFVVLGKWAPRLLRPLHKAWMALAIVLGFFTSRIILCILYYCVLTPIGVIMRLLGKDPLDRRWDEEARSYWIKKERKTFDKEQYKKLY